MFEVEGARREECIKLLRHECGHAVQHAYQLQRLRRWQKAFGKASTPYPELYRPNPHSKRFVQHLDAWYAQSHPEEDFAETFAVWLTPRSRWRQRYARWPARKKLELVDELMGEIADAKPRVRSRARPFALSKLRKTLRQHYEEKREFYSPGYTDLYDPDLRRLFSSDPRHAHRETAAAFLRRNRREIRDTVAEWTGDYLFTLEQVLKDMMGRCKELKLRVQSTERQTKLAFCIMLTVHSMQYVFTGRDWHAL